MSTPETPTADPTPEIPEAQQENPDFPAVLDLSTADTRGNYMEAGWKEAVISGAEIVYTKNAAGNLPLNTPGINVQFTIDGGQYNDRKVWNRYWFPPASYDKEKRDRTLGMFVNFLGELGYDKDQIKTEGFSLERVEELVGKECRVNTRYDEDYDNNKVIGVRARGAAGSADANPSGAGVL